MVYACIGLWGFFDLPDADADVVPVGSVVPLYRVMVSAVESVQAKLVVALTPNSPARGSPQPQP